MGTCLAHHKNASAGKRFVQREVVCNILCVPKQKNIYS
jgi:hypothetical protein